MSRGNTANQICKGKTREWYKTCALSYDLKDITMKISGEMPNNCV